jgi:hypothetical protein
VGQFYARPAQAQTAGVEYVMILLDQTGSMATVADTTTGLTFWDNAVSAAQAWVAQDDAPGRPRRAYSIWTFFDIDCPGCGPGGQNGAKQVWPALDGSSTDCTGTVEKFDSTGTSSFCLFPANSTTVDDAYVNLQATLGDPGDTTASNIRNSRRAVTGVGNTPLADSLCQSLEKLQALLSNNSRVLTLETDAGENDSVSYCSSLISTTNLASNATSFNKNSVGQTAGQPGDWDLSVDVSNPSWEAKVMRRSVRLGTLPPSGGVANGNTAVATPIKAGEDLPSGSTGYKLRIDTHFRICHPTDPPPCSQTSALAIARPGILLPSLGVMAQVATEPKGNLRAPAAAKLNITSATTAPFSVNQATIAAPKTTTTTLSAQAVTTQAATTAATTSPGVPLIDSNEFLFFQGLGHVNTKSTFHAVTADSAVVFGTTHKLAGDVDDSGCVDRADFSIIKQKDVWYQRAVQPLQIAIRADLNRDGWVNRADAQIVINNWGHGCINPVGPPPKL